MNRKDFRPNDSSSKISDKDRYLIKEYKGQKIEDRDNAKPSEKKLPIYHLGMGLFYKDTKNKVYKNIDNEHDTRPLSYPKKYTKRVTRSELKSHEYSLEMNRNPNKYREDSKRIAKTYHGYVIGRKMIDDDGKLKNFCYYPNDYHGKPPHMYKTKEQALKEYAKEKKNDKFPANESNSVVFKYTPRSYLDIY